MNSLINPNDPDLVQELHREEIDCKEKECEVKEALNSLTTWGIPCDVIEVLHVSAHLYIESKKPKSLNP